MSEPKMKYKPMEWVICDICACQYPKFLGECPHGLDPLGHLKLVIIEGCRCYVNKQGNLEDDIDQDLEGWPE